MEMTMTTANQTQITAEIREAASMFLTGRTRLASYFGGNLSNEHIELLAQVTGAEVLEAPAVSNVERIGVAAKPTVKEGLPPPTTFKDRILAVLIANDTPMDAAAILQDLETLGWAPKSQNPKGSVSALLSAHPDLYERVDRGRYTVKGGKSESVASSKGGTDSTLKRVQTLLATASKGMTIGAIGKELGVDTKTLSPVLKQGLESKIFRKRGQRRGTTYSLRNGDGTEAKGDAAEMDKNEARERAIKVLQQTQQPITVTDIVKKGRLEGHHKAVNFLMMNLQRGGAVKKLRKKSESGRILWEVQPDAFRDFVERYSKKN